MTAGLKPCYLAGSVHFITFSCYRSQTFTYDFFGNINKSGSVSFSSQGGNGNQVPGLTYDGAGNVMTDNQGNTFMYDTEMRPVSINGNWITYDAFNRAVEIQTGSNSYEQVLYSPTGQKIAFMNGSAVVSYTLPMPAGVQAVYNAGGLWYYRFADWLGSSRLAAYPTGSYTVSRSIAPFGETYDGAANGPSDRLFTGQTQDEVAGPQGIYDFLFRQQSSSQGRWLVPDPAGLAAVDPTNPQTWNRYAYVANNPLSNIDPLGLRWICTGPPDDQTCSWEPDPGDSPGLGSTSGPAQGNRGPVRISQHPLSGPQIVRNASGDIDIIDTPVTDMAVNGDDAPMAQIVQLSVSTIGLEFGHLVEAAGINLGSMLRGKGGPPLRLFMSHWCGPGGAGKTVTDEDPSCQQHDTCFDDLHASATDWMTYRMGLPSDPTLLQGMRRCNQQFCESASADARTSTDAGQVWLIRSFFQCK